jgi:carboxylate-amine ligase
VFGLHVHVAVRGGERALAVHNALRSYLPDLAALAGNAPLHGGRDTGLASLRPKLCDLLPRQGVPPAWRSWEERAEFERWGRRGGIFPAAGEPWYELRVHDEHGTIELRVPDTQSTVEESAGVLALAAALVAWLAERHDAGEPLPVHDHDRIAENRWRAMRHGLGGSLLDLDSGEPEPARARIVALIDSVAPAAERLGGAAELEHARALAARNGAERQRSLAAERGVRGVVAWLADAFVP